MKHIYFLINQNDKIYLSKFNLFHCHTQPVCESLCLQWQLQAVGNGDGEMGGFRSSCGLGGRAERDLLCSCVSIVRNLCFCLLCLFGTLGCLVLSLGHCPSHSPGTCLLMPFSIYKTEIEEMRAHSLVGAYQPTGDNQEEPSDDLL